jgi:hypothetical protein
VFSGAQVALYPMTGDFVRVILGSLSALDPYRDHFRIETDDLSTLLVGPPEELFPAMRDLHVAASWGDVHCVLHATVSRGCPGEPDDPICTPIQGRQAYTPLDERIEAALDAARPRQDRMSPHSSHSTRWGPATIWTRSMGASTS